MKSNLIILLLLFIVATSCKNQRATPSNEHESKKFKLEANITDISDSAMFHIKSLKTNIDLDSAYLINGHLNLEGLIESNQPEKLLLSSTDPISKEFIYTLLIVGNEQLRFNAKKSDFPWNIDVSGSLHQDKAENFNQIEHQRQEIIKELRLAYSSDKELLSKKISSTSDSINNVIVKLIIEKPNSYAAVDFFKYHKSKFSNEELIGLYNKLDEELKESREGKAIKLQSEYTKPEVGDKYYDYQAINQNGDTVALSDFKDKYVLLHFSSSACYYSQLSLPEAKKLYKAHKNNLEIVSISEDSSRKQWQNTVKKDSIPWTYLWDGKGEYSDAVVKYWSIGTPDYFLISPDKIILEKWFGYEDGIIKDKLEKHLVE